MININSKDNRYYLEYYNDNGNYKKKYIDKVSLIPVKRVKPTDDYLKKVKDAYTGKYYYVKKNYNNYTPSVTIPYKINTNKEGIPYYDYQLGMKLLHFGRIIKRGIEFPRHVYYDIETTSLDPADGVLTNIVFIDADDDVKVFTNDDGNEKKMLEDVADYLRKNRIISLIGFNSKKFDDEYLRYRMNINQVEYNPIMSCNIDIMLMCNKLFVSGSLASIAKQLGVIEKIELESNPVRLFYDGDFDTLIEYNIRDVEVTKAISEKMNILPFVKALWELSWCDFRHLNANSKLNDCYFNKRMWEDNIMVSKADLKYKGNFGGGFNYFKRS